MPLSSVDSPHGFVGQSPQIRAIRFQVDRIANSRSPVLLLGESGTGKEVVARALFGSNPRGAFIPIDCGSLVGPLMESELFGHTKGAFTGAAENKRGLIELADGGTAFFDEIGDLPLELQVKLLRLLQEREFRPVGSLHRRKVDLRIIAATHRNLSREVEAGRFRQDLYYRLNVIKITLPPLRERKQDIPALLEQFLSFHGHYFIPPPVLDVMMAHDWPGNVRELQNCVDRMAAINPGPELRLEDLPSQVYIPPHTNQTAELANLATAVGTGPVVTLEQVERQAILQALSHTRGDRAVAAVLLGIGRTTLYRKLKAYNLEIEPGVGCNLQPRP